MTSYAQNFEDVLIRRALQDIIRGYYIDVGAFDATADSVTRWFYDNGWRGVNVEPNPALHAKLERDRPEDENLKCAISSISGSVQFNVIEDTGLSTLLDEQALLAKTAGYDVSSKVEVPTQTLDQLLEAYGKDRTIDFLKIDVEGSETDILNAAHFATVRPRLLIIEAVKSFGLEPAWHNWEPSLLTQGYTFVWFDGLNRFYVRDEDEWRRALFGIPPSAFDNFTGHYYSLALNEVARKDTLLETERANGALLLAERDLQLADKSALYEALQMQSQNLARSLAERDSQLADKSALYEALQTQSQDLARSLAERDSQLADKSLLYEAAQTQGQDLARSLAERDSQLADKSALYDALQTQSRELSRSLAEREQALAEQESAVLLLSIRLDARHLETREQVHRNRGEQEPTSGSRLAS
jgi:FkbM family methyltransferase